MTTDSFRPAADGTAPRRVLLVCPPFQHLGFSSLAIVRLATFVRGQGVHCDEAYLHFDLARILGADRYRAAMDADISAELLFAEGLHGDIRDRAFNDKLDSLFGTREERIAILRELVARTIERVEREKPDIVGFTTSGNQLMAALFLGRAIKQRSPAVAIVLGGSACTEPMGQRLLEGYPHVDFVVSGEGDYPLLSLGRGENPPGRLIHSQAAIDLETLPLPDYDRYLSEAGEFDEKYDLQLAFESSRGCWWGQKHQCAFCGLNGENMAYQGKSSERVFDDISTLWKRYGHKLFATDTILSLDHLRQVMPRLGALEKRPGVFYEVKSNMTAADVEVLARANVWAMQPGIESLSTRLLELLNKGVTAIQNLALLKWCRERGIRATWNLLIAIPGEQAIDYYAQIALFAKIPHFQPPKRLNPIRIDRFSPYFNCHVAHGWSAIVPQAEYRAMHPHLGEAALADIAYHFDGVGGVSSEEYLGPLEKSFADWHRRFEAFEGLFLDPSQGLVRNAGSQSLRYTLTEQLERVLACTHEVAPIARVLQQTGCDRAFLAELLRNGIVHIEDDRVLNLAVRAKPPRAAAIGDT
jgi:ribosomal peptide maturation radical SAM protein 1